MIGQRASRAPGSPARTPRRGSRPSGSRRPGLVPGVPDLLRPDTSRPAAVLFDPLDRARADGSAAGRGQRFRVGPADGDQGHHEDERHDPANATTSEASMRTPPPRLFGRRRRVRPLQLSIRSSRRKTARGRCRSPLITQRSSAGTHMTRRRARRPSSIASPPPRAWSRAAPDPGRASSWSARTRVERRAVARHSHGDGPRVPGRRCRAPPSTSRRRSSSGALAPPRPTTTRRSCRAPGRASAGQRQQHGDGADVVRPRRLDRVLASFSAASWSPSTPNDRRTRSMSRSRSNSPRRTRVRWRGRARRNRAASTSSAPRARSSPAED